MCLPVNLCRLNDKVLLVSRYKTEGLAPHHDRNKFIDLILKFQRILNPLASCLCLFAYFVHSVQLTSYNKLRHQQLSPHRAVTVT